MNEDNKEYSKREIDVYMLDIKDSLHRIEAQTLKTNGRVTGLENKQTNLAVWRGMITGGLIVTNVVLLPLLFMVIRSFFKQ